MQNVFVRVLSIGPFRDLWLSQLVSQVFSNLLFFSLMIRVYELTHSNSAVSLMVLMVMLPNILLGALAGVLVDRWDKKVVMFLSHFLRLFTVLTFLLSSETLGLLYVLAFLFSAITQFFFPAEASTIHDVVGSKKLLLTANSLFSLTFFLSVILGNVLAGPLLSVFGDRGTYFICALAFLVASYFTSRLPGRRLAEWLVDNTNKWLSHTLVVWKNGIEWGAILAEFMAGIDHIYKDKAVARAIFVAGISQATIGILGSVAPGFADRILHVPPNTISLLVMAPAALGMVSGAVVLGQFFAKSDRGKVMGAGLIAAAGSLAVFAWVDKLALILPLPVFLVSSLLLVALGGANAFMAVPVNTIVQERTPEPIRSRVFGILSLATGVGSIVPVVLAGVVADILGVRSVVFFTGLLLLILGQYLRRKYAHL